MARQVLWKLKECLLFLVIALCATWPLARHLTTHLPLGTEPAATVPLFNLWSLNWNANRAAHFGVNYWQAPIFAPTPDPFAFSEAQLTTMALAPVVWLSETPVFACNLYVLLSLMLNGFVGFILLRKLHFHWAAAVAGGAMIELLPFIHWQLGIYQLIPLWPALWTIIALLGFSRSPDWKTALNLGAAFAVTFHTCGHYGLFLSTILLCSSGFLLGGSLLKWRTWAWGAAAVVTAGVLLIPIAIQFHTLKQHEFTRGAELVERLSAHWGDYTSTPWKQPLNLPNFAEPLRKEGWTLGPGHGKLLLALLGILTGFCTAGRRKWTAFCLMGLTISFGLSLGTEAHLGEWTLYGLLAEYHPGYEQVRNIFRFAAFTQLFVALLTAGALDFALSEQVRHWGIRLSQRFFASAHGGIESPAPVIRWGGMVIWCVLAIYVILEVRPSRQRLYETPSLQSQAGWTQWLKSETPPEAVIACIPFPKGVTVHDYLDTTLWMYWGCFHQRPMVNGYSGFFPNRFLELKAEMEKFPYGGSLHMLRENGVRYLVVRYTEVPRELLTFHPRIVNQVEWKYRDEQAGVDIFELKELSTAPE